jgi:hypothetical protein
MEQASKPQHNKKLAKLQGGLNIGQLWDVGKKAKDKQVKLYQARIDHVIMRLICVRGLVPHIIDSPEWKELVGLLNGTYHPTSADVFIDKHIPHEAVYVHEKQIEKLWAINNLTLTFNRNTTQKPQSIYTVHATTPSHESYLLDAHEESDEWHTTEWVKDKLLKVRSPLCFRFVFVILSVLIVFFRQSAQLAKITGEQHVLTAQTLQRQLVERPPASSLLSWTFVMWSITFISTSCLNWNS